MQRQPSVGHIARRATVGRGRACCPTVGRHAVVKMDQLIAAQWTASEQPWVFPGMDLFSYQRIASLAMLVLGNVKQPKKTNHMEIPNALKQNNLDFAIGR